MNGFRITLDENTHEEFDYLIIADGIFSKTKSLILNDITNPKYNFNVALRGKVKVIMVVIFLFIWHQTVIM